MTYIFRLEDCQLQCNDPNKMYEFKPDILALLRRIAPSSVVCPSVFLSLCQCVTLVSLAKKRLKRSSYHLRSELGWAQWTTYYMRFRCQHGKGQFWGGNRQTIVNNTDTPRSFVQRRLNRLRCRLGCGHAWAESITCYVGGPDPPWEVAIPVDRGAHCKVQALFAISCAKMASTICHFDCRLEWAEGCTSSIVFARWRQCVLVEGHIAVICRITHWTTRLRRRCAY